MKKINIIFYAIGIFFLLGIAFLFLNKEKEVILEEEVEQEIIDLSELKKALAKTEEIESLRYTIKTQSSNEAVVTKFWHKENKVRMEVSGQRGTSLYLMDFEAQTGYLHVVGSGVATEIDLSRAGEITDGAIKKEARNIMNYDPTIIRRDVLEEKECLVISYEKNDREVVAWIWEEYGLPVKKEMIFDGWSIISVVSEIEFVDLSDAIFTLPSAIEIIDDFIFL